MARSLRLPALLLSAAAAASSWAQAPDSVRPGPKPSERLNAALLETARELRKSETGRRLLALTEALAVVERPRRPGPAIRYERGEPGVLVIDSDRAPGLSGLEFECMSVVERWRAAAALPGAFADEEMAARQALLAHVLEKAEVDPDFAAKLRAASSGQRELLEQRRVQRDWARKRGDDGAAVFPGPPPRDPVSVLARGLYLFSEDQYLFYKEAAGAGPSGPTLDEAADFLERHGAEMSRLGYRAEGSYAVIDGRMFPAAPARAAAALGRDGLRRAAERLGDFRGAPREALLKRVNAWLRAAP
ncbi:MAG: hypothetical protein HY928_03405 [Elusimicrobia bacterium]|nr:hypothetical protein [Elusimicrobiota bacterium]